MRVESLATTCSWGRKSVTETIGTTAATSRETGEGRAYDQSNPNALNRVSVRADGVPADRLIRAALSRLTAGAGAEIIEPVARNVVAGAFLDRRVGAVGLG